MNRNNEPWQAAIDSLLEGDLPADEAKTLRSEAEQNAALAQAIIDANQLQNQLDSLGLERAPKSLRRRLRAIPAEQRRGIRPVIRWAGLSAATLVLVFGIVNRTNGPTAAEVEQARAELAIALSYVESFGLRANENMRKEIGNAMHQALVKGIQKGVGKKQENS